MDKLDFLLYFPTHPDFINPTPFSLTYLLSQNITCIFSPSCFYSICNSFNLSNTHTHKHTHSYTWWVYSTFQVPNSEFTPPFLSHLKKWCFFQSTFTVVTSLLSLPLDCMPSWGQSILISYIILQTEMVNKKSFKGNDFYQSSQTAEKRCGTPARGKKDARNPWRLLNHGGGFWLDSQTNTGWGCDGGRPSHIHLGESPPGFLVCSDVLVQICLTLSTEIFQTDLDEALILSPVLSCVFL